VKVFGIKSKFLDIIVSSNCFYYNSSFQKPKEREILVTAVVIIIKILESYSSQSFFQDYLRDES
jgi:hypothetical protein